MPSDKPTLTVRIPPEIRQRLENHAKENSRSVSNMLTVLLKEYFEEQDKTSLPPDNNQQVASLLESEKFIEYEKIKNLPLEERKAIAKKLLSN